MIRRRNRHQFESYHEDSCWCGRHRRSRIHRGKGSERSLLSTPLGRSLYPDDARRAEKDVYDVMGDHHVEDLWGLDYDPDDRGEDE